MSEIANKAIKKAKTKKESLSIFKKRTLWSQDLDDQQKSHEQICRNSLNSMSLLDSVWCFKPLDQWPHGPTLSLLQGGTTVGSATRRQWNGEKPFW